MTTTIAHAQKRLYPPENWLVALDYLLEHVLPEVTSRKQLVMFSPPAKTSFQLNHCRLQYHANKKRKTLVDERTWKQKATDTFGPEMRGCYPVRKDIQISKRLFGRVLLCTALQACVCGCLCV